MKLTESRLRHIIREELAKLSEDVDPSALFSDDLEGMIKEYFYRSMTGEWDDPYFWDQLFEQMLPRFRRKSIEHGFLGKEPLKDYYKQLAMGPREHSPELQRLGRRPTVADVPVEFTISNNWITITEGEIVKHIKKAIDENRGRPLSVEEVFDVIIEHHVRRFQDAFGQDVHRDIYEIYKDMKNHENLSQKKKINLANRAIHAEHKTGTVLDIYPDPDDLRDSAEEEYDQRSQSKVARARNNPKMI